MEDLYMAKIIGSPSRYVQGKGELKNLCTYSSAFAKKLFFILFVFVETMIAMLE